MTEGSKSIVFFLDKHLTMFSFQATRFKVDGDDLLLRSKRDRKPSQAPHCALQLSQLLSSYERIPPIDARFPPQLMNPGSRSAHPQVTALVWLSEPAPRRPAAARHPKADRFETQIDPQVQILPKAVWLAGPIQSSADGKSSTAT
jgi:hypothetical protein